MSTFAHFQQINKERYKSKVFHHCSDWNMSDWIVALTGEVGEFANLYKKVRRGDLTLDQARENLGRELADVITYADLLMTELGLDTGMEVLRKFHEVSKRVGYDPEALKSRLLNFTPKIGDKAECVKCACKIEYFETGWLHTEIPSDYFADRHNAIPKQT